MVTSNTNITGEGQGLDLNGKVIEYLKNVYGLDIKDAEQVLNTYRDSLRTNLDVLDTAINTDDFNEIEHQAHSAKGAFLNIGLEKQAELAKEIEFAARSGESCDYSGMTTRLRQMISSLLKQ